jgi:hypothetical protein
VQEEYSFPNIYYCTGCYNEIYWFNSLQPDNSVLIKYSRRDRDQSVPINTYLSGFDHKGDFRCHLNYFELNRIKSQKYCFAVDYIVEFLKSELNFTKTPHRNLLRRNGEPTFGGITDSTIDNFAISESSFNFLTTESEMSATYCDFSPPRTSQINFGAWWGPYQLKVWGFLSNSFLALSFVLAISKLYKYNGGQMHKSVTVVDVFQSWSDMILSVIRCILRQDEFACVILNTCAFCMLIFTCLYENIITSKLIVPDEEMRYENIAELTNNGYSIIVQFDNDITLDIKLPDSLNKILFGHFQKSGKSKLEFDNVRFVFRSSADESYIVDLGNASLKYAWLHDNNKLMLSYNEKMLSKFHQIPCHIVRNPLTQSLKFVYFVNFLVFE